MSKKRKTHECKSNLTKEEKLEVEKAVLGVLIKGLFQIRERFAPDDSDNWEIIPAEKE